jgi:hypothetical protein
MHSYAVNEASGFEANRIQFVGESAIAALRWVSLFGGVPVGGDSIHR